MIKPTALFAVTLILGGTVLASPTAATSPLTRNAKTKILVSESESGDLIAGRRRWRRHSRDSFEVFYLRNCGFRYSLEECYNLYQYGRLGKRRRFSRRRRRIRRIHDRYYDHGRRRRGDDDD